MSKAIDDLVTKLSGLTVLEMAELKTALEDKWGVKAAAAVAAVAAAPGEEKKEVQEEATEFDVVLESFEERKKIGVINDGRTITELPLQEAKALVVEAPSVLEKAVSKEEATKIEELLKGKAKVTIKPA